MAFKASPSSQHQHCTEEAQKAETVLVEWSGVEWSGVEWSGVEWSGVEWSGVVERYFTPEGSPRSLPLLFLVSESFPEVKSNPVEL